MAFGFSKKRKDILHAGEQAPPFRLTGPDGVERTPEQLTNGVPVLLAFYKASCPVCQFTFPFLERISKGAGLRVFGVSQDDAKTAGRFAKEHGVTFPMLVDESSGGYAASNAFGITSVPSLFLIDPGGTIAVSVEGFIKRDLADLGRRAGVEVFCKDEYVPEWKAG